LIVLLIIGLLIAVFFMLASTQYMDKFRKAGAADDDTSQARIHLWSQGMRMASMNPVFGVGINNYSLYNSKVLHDSDPHVSHNIFIQCVSETGFAGLTLLLVLITNNFLINRRSRTLLASSGYREEEHFLYDMTHALDIGIAGYLVSGFFICVLYYPFLWVYTALTVSLSGIVKRTVAAHRADAVPIGAL